MSSINSVVLMSDSNNFSIELPINPYYKQSFVNHDKAKTEHKDLHKTMTNAGITILDIPSPTGCQDGVYIANWALIRNNKAVLANLPNARKNEEKYAEKVLKCLGIKVTRVPKKLKFSGQGDALACGNLLFCGNGYRSDKAAQAFAAKVLGYELVQLQTIPLTDSNNNPIINSSSGWADSYFYDIDLALAVIKAPDGDNKGLIAYCPEAFMPSSRKLLADMNQVDKIKVSISEARDGYATNLVSTGTTVIMSGKAPKLANNLRKHGLEVITPKITELSKGGGYIRCMTLTIC